VGTYKAPSSVIFDIDGTLADCTHRLHHIQTKPKDWDGFFAAMSGDTLIKPVAELLDAFVHQYRHTIVLCSGRPETYREPTEKWLAMCGIKWSRLYMRQAGDRRDDSIVKKELLDQIRADGWKPFLAIDDRQRVVDMWRANGLVCLQCADGDF
jgi:nicotinamidase-related amidase